MLVLLTGHDGYIGAVMSQRLLEAGHDVVGLDSQLFDGCDFGTWKQPIETIRGQGYCFRLARSA